MSIIVARQPRRSAANAVVHAPAKGSSTLPPAGHDADMHRRANFSGYTAGCKPPAYFEVAISQTSRPVRSSALGQGTASFATSELRTAAFGLVTIGSRVPV